MYQNRVITIILTGLLLSAAACTVTTQAPEATATAPPTVASTDESTIEPGDEPSIVAHRTEIGGYGDLVDALRAAGATLEPAGEIKQPFFSVGGRVITVDGGDVQVFEYPDAAAAEVDAALISPDASAVGASMMTWVATPHFYALDRVIVLYVGDDEAVVEALNGALGQPVAEGQVLPQAEPDTATALAEALTAGDYAALEGLMGDSLTIGYWRSEGQVLTPAEVIEVLRLNLLPNPGAVSFIRDQAHFPDLGGVDPASAFGPDVQIVDLVYSQGWGVDGLGEAILAIAEDADGSQYWRGIIYSFAGFSEMTGQAPQEPALSYEAAIYRNEANGFEFDYPSSWSFEEDVLGERGSGAQFLSEGEFVLSAIVYLWDPKNDLDAYVDHWRRGWSTSGASVLSEAESTLAGGRRAVQFEIADVDNWTKFVMFTEAGDRYLQLSGPGNLSLLAEIAQTLRPLEATTMEPITELAVFENQVVAAITSGDLAQMQALMDETFGFAFWGSEGYAASPEEAIEQLRLNYLQTGHTITFEDTLPDLSAGLGKDSDVLSIWNPATNPIGALFSTGWGPDGDSKAILIVVQSPDGILAWDGIILAHGKMGGFTSTGNDDG